MEEIIVDEKELPEIVDKLSQGIANKIDRETMEGYGIFFSKTDEEKLFDFYFPY